MSNEAHMTLLESVKNLEGAFILRGYSNEMYEQAASECCWSREEKDRKCSASHIAKTRKAKGGTEQPTRTEVVLYRGPKL